MMTTDWSEYDGSPVVYQPMKMTVEELEDGVNWVWEQNASFGGRLAQWFS
jgi:hypothetical protein